MTDTPSREAVLCCPYCGGIGLMEQWPPGVERFHCVCNNDCGVIGPWHPTKERACESWQSLSGPARPARAALPEKVPEGFVRVRAHFTTNAAGHWCLMGSTVGGMIVPGDKRGVLEGVIVSDLPLPRPPQEVVGVVEEAQ